MPVGQKVMLQCLLAAAAVQGLTLEPSARVPAGDVQLMQLQPAANASELLGAVAVLTASDIFKLGQNVGDPPGATSSSCSNNCIYKACYSMIIDLSRYTRFHGYTLAAGNKMKKNAGSYSKHVIKCDDQEVFSKSDGTVHATDPPIDFPASCVGATKVELMCGGWCGGCSFFNSLLYVDVPPTLQPTSSPTSSPTRSPTAYPTVYPTSSPTTSPTSSPTPSPTTSPTSTPTSSPTSSPTPSPTTSPTSTPTSSPTVSRTPSPSPAASADPSASKSADSLGSPDSGPQLVTAAAKGDPHLTNMRGQRFDLMQSGRHVLVQIPRSADRRSPGGGLLRVEADARQVGGQCADVYFQALNVTGRWAGAGFRFAAGSRVDASWRRLGSVDLKVVAGHTGFGVAYLNVFVRGLSQAGFSVGGLLGEDDHTSVATPSAACQHALMLAERSYHTSTAEAQ